VRSTNLKLPKKCGLRHKAKKTKPTATPKREQNKSDETNTKTMLNQNKETFRK
jgi:hypothetical protein